MTDRTERQEASSDPLVSLSQLQGEATKRLPAEIADHIAGGAGTEATVRRNALAFDSVAFRPRILRDVSAIDSRADVLGGNFRLPVALAPIGSLHKIAPSAPMAAIEAAGRFGIPAFVSSIAEPGITPIAAAGSGMKILQLYVRGDLGDIEALFRDARQAGYGAVAVTVDTATYGIRDRQRLAKWTPRTRRGGGREHQARLTWEIMDDIVSAASPMPVMLKGIQTAEDAVLAVERGHSVLYVSNHGGRQLDHARATLDVLREVRAAVGAGPEILLDGGIRRGTDVLKALAFGASGVAIGRLTAMALAQGGADGVVRMLELLEEEIRNAMALLGVRSYAALDESYVADVMPLPNAVADE